MLSFDSEVTENELTGASRSCALCLQTGLGGYTAFLQWTRENLTEYYKIAASLIPTEIHHKEDNTIRVIIAPVPHYKHVSGN